MLDGEFSRGEFMPTIKQEHIDKLQEHSGIIHGCVNPDISNQLLELDKESLREWLFLLRHSTMGILKLIDQIKDEHKNELPEGFETDYNDILKHWGYFWSSWFCENAGKGEKDEEGFYRLDIPFKDCAGHRISVYIRLEDDGNFYLTDLGETVYYVAESKTVREGFVQTINNICYNRGTLFKVASREIFTTASKEELPLKLLDIIVCILAVDSWQVVFLQIVRDVFDDVP